MSKEIIKTVSSQLSRSKHFLSQIKYLLPDLYQPQYIPYRKGDKWGFCDSEKKILIPCIFDRVHFFLGGYSTISLNGNENLIDTQGHLMLPSNNRYVATYYSSKEFIIIINSDKKCVVLNRDFEEVLPPRARYNEISYVKGVFKFRNEIDSLCGLIDSKGNLILPCKYQNIREISNLYYGIWKKNKWGVINLLGMEIYPCIFKVIITHRGFIEFKVGKDSAESIYFLKNSDVIINSKYNKLFENLYNFKHERIMVGIKYTIEDRTTVHQGKTTTIKGYEDFYYGFINLEGKEVIACTYSSFGYFNEGLVSFMRFSKESNSSYYGYMDIDGNELITITYPEKANYILSKWLTHPYFTPIFHGMFCCGLALKRYKGKFGYINKSGKEIIPLKYDSGKDFKKGFAAVKINEKWGFIDLIGNIKIEFQYDEVLSNYHLEEGWEVCINDKRGIVNDEGIEIVSCKYDEINKFDGEIAIVKLGNLFGAVNKYGKEIVPFIYTETESLRLQLNYDKNKPETFVYTPLGYVDKNGVKYWED